MNAISIAIRTVTKRAKLFEMMGGFARSSNATTAIAAKMVAIINNKVRDGDKNKHKAATVDNNSGKFFFKFFATAGELIFFIVNFLEFLFVVMKKCNFSVKEDSLTIYGCTYLNFAKKLH